MMNAALPQHSNSPTANHLLTLFDKLTKHITARSLYASARAFMTPLAGVKVVSTSSSTRLRRVCERVQGFRSTKAAAPPAALRELLQHGGEGRRARHLREVGC